VNEQKLLFQPDQDVWIERLWRRVPAATRRQILAILAEMAKAALANHGSSKPKEADDER
jgi:hypothetical protein